MIVSVNIDDQLVLQNLPFHSCGGQLCAILSKYEPATVQQEDKDCPRTVCIAFANKILLNWSSDGLQMKGRRVMMETIKFIESLSYRMVVNFKVEAHRAECVFFERKSEQLTRPQTDLLMTSFLDDGKIAIIGDPMKSDPVSAISSLIDQVVRCSWPLGVAPLNTSAADFDLVELLDAPWICHFDVPEGALSRLVVGRIFEQMLIRGWMVREREVS